MNNLIIDEYSQILNELYVGETQFIKQLIQAVSKAREPYVGKLKRPIKGNKDFIKIGDMIAEEFGFHSVSFMVPYDTSLNAFTYPITQSFDKSVMNVKPKFTKNKGLKYDKNIGNLCIIVAVTAGVWFNEKFTDREVVAAILHEIGHSFALQSKALTPIIETTRIITLASIIYNLIIDIYNKDVQSMSQDARAIIMSSNKGKEIMNVIYKQCANNPLFSGFNTIGAFTEYFTGIVTNVFKEISAFLNFGPMQLYAIPSAAIQAIISIILHPFTVSKRSQEYLSDSFATMYGMGPDLTSFLSKIHLDASPSGSEVERILNTTPIIGKINELCRVPILLIMNSVSDHPSLPARTQKILDELNQEIKNSDLDPKTKLALKKDIQNIEKIKDEYLAMQEDDYMQDAESVKRAYFNYLTNMGRFFDDMENHYTDLKARDKYVREALTPKWNDIEII